MTSDRHFKALFHSLMLLVSMTFLLDTKNVFNYLIQHRLCHSAEKALSQIYPKVGKNFNLLVCLLGDRHLLVKQEPFDASGQTNGDLEHEWQLHQLIQHYPELHPLQAMISEALHFEPKQAIAVFNYLNHYQTLDDFYDQPDQMPVAVAAHLGQTLARIHQATYQRSDYKAFLATLNDEIIDQVPEFGHGLADISPEIFGSVSVDALKFYELYQRYELLGEAIAALKQAYHPCCITHHDLKFNNILLHTQWHTSIADSPIRFIDWEKWAWGDPALDLGALIAEYLKRWLKSLVVSPEIELQMALRLATQPLETLQPSMISLTQAYFQQFPELGDRDFLLRVMQFTGWALIESIQARIHYHEPFGNVGICFLQVAKTLLCAPEQSINTVFGISAAELLQCDRQLSTSDAISPPLAGSYLPESDLSPSKRSPLDNPDRIPTSNRCQLSELEWSNPAHAQTIETVLADILQHLTIKLTVDSAFEIAHSRYKPLEMPPHVGLRYHQLPDAFQHHYLRQQLRNYLHDIYFSGEQPLAAAPEQDESQALKNDQMRGLNLAFYQQLQDQNHGTGYFDSGWRVVRSLHLTSPPAQFVVQKQGLSLQIHAVNPATVQCAESADNSSLAVGSEVAIRLPNHQIENGFYVAVGNAGFVSEQQPAVELYFNFSAEGAIALMATITKVLNAQAMPFCFKVLLDPAEYRRYDAGVLQIAQSAYDSVHPFLQQIYQQTRSHFSAAVPLFTKPLAPGLSLAEVPETEPSEFGIHRCQILAEAVLTARQTEADPQAHLAQIKQTFLAHGIDLQRPYLNTNCQDCYISLDNERNEEDSVMG